MDEQFKTGFEKTASMKKILEKIRKVFTGNMFPKAKKMKDSTGAWDALRKKELKAKL